MTELGLARTVTDEIIVTGERVKEGKIKFKARRRTKHGTIVITCADYPDHIRVITIDVVGGGRRR